MITERPPIRSYADYVNELMLSQGFEGPIELGKIGFGIRNDSGRLSSVGSAPVRSAIIAGYNLDLSAAKTSGADFAQGLLAIDPNIAYQRTY